MPNAQVRGLYDDRRKRAFLKNLANSSHVTASAAAANVSLSTLYVWRNRDPDFRRRWNQALAAGYELLEMELLDRARNGVVKDVFHAGRRVAKVRAFNDGLGLKLLLAHKQMVALTRAAENAVCSDQARASLDRKLGDMRTKLLRRRALAEGRARPPASNDDR